MILDSRWKMKRLFCFLTITGLALCRFERPEASEEPVFSEFESIKFKINLTRSPEVAVRAMTEEQQIYILKGVAGSLFHPMIELGRIYIKVTVRLELISSRLAEEKAAEKLASERRAAREKLERERYIAAEKELWAKRRKKYPHWSEEVWTAIRSYRVFLGMTREQARMSWGNPSDINRTITAYGVYEQWVYGTYSHRYLYFEDGILTTIQD